MPTSQVSLVYTADALGVSSVALTAAMAAVPLPQDILSLYGVYPTSDIPSPGVRSIILALVPSASATATAQLSGSETADYVFGLTLTSGGHNYAAPPTVTFSLPVGTFSPLRQARAQAQLGVDTATVATGGALYSANPTVTVVGNVGPGGTPAVLSVTVALGVITAVTIVNPGSGYMSIPKVVITDPTGSGATITVTLNVVGLTLLDPGQGYVLAPTVTLVPWFKSLFPDSSDQTKPFWNLMTVAIQQATLSSITASPPVVT
jgi:hypothetical protein